MTKFALGRGQGRRTASVLLATLIVMVAASFASHALVGDPSDGSDLAKWMPPVIGPLGTLLFLRVIWLARGRAPGPVWFLAVPAISLLLQETVERPTHAHDLLATGSEPVALAVIAVQVPFAVLAFVLARLLKAAVRRFQEILRAPAPHVVVARHPLAWSGPMLFRPLGAVAIGAHSGRAPPPIG